MIYLAGVLFIMIVVLVLFSPYATERSDKVVKIYTYFLYILIAAWLSVMMLNISGKYANMIQLKIPNEHQIQKPINSITPDSISV
jgi:uncharacterized membrane protein YkvI